MAQLLVRKRILKRIHVSQPRIKRNQKKDKDLDPPIIVVSTDGYEHGNTVSILDEDGKVVARVIYNPERPICSGARVWIETRNAVIIES